MKPTFHINKFGAQKKSPTIDSYLTDEYLKDIAYSLIKTHDFDTKWESKKIEGNLIRLETDDHIYFICLSEHGDFDFRNSQLQKVPTAFSRYLFEQRKEKKKCSFHFYFLPLDNNNCTDYLKFMYRLMVTCGIEFINREFGLPDFVPAPFTDVADMIRARNESKKRNSGNRSTYITDEGDSYHIYGKTFGANQKETALLCMAIVAIATKNVRLFQIIDNKSKKISKNDVKAINIFKEIKGNDNFHIMEETIAFDEDGNETTDNLRLAKFIYNLFAKYGSPKCCALCDCKVEKIVQGAHIYPIAKIRNNNSLSEEKKIEYATDADNGLWLCENHHKLFDSGLIAFTNDEFAIPPEVEKEDREFIESITKHYKIKRSYFNDKMRFYFNLRNNS